MAYATWNGVEIPRVREVSTTDDLRADESETAGLNLRRDVAGYRRRWTLRTGPVRPEQADALAEAIRSVVYGVGDFWIRGLPGPVKALADPPEVTWTPEGYRQISITIKERTAHRG